MLLDLPEHIVTCSCPDSLPPWCACEMLKCLNTITQSTSQFESDFFISPHLHPYETYPPNDQADLEYSKNTQIFFWQKNLWRGTKMTTDKPDPIVFLPVTVSTSGRVELPEESDQFRFLRAVRLAKLKGSVGLILAKPSTMRVTFPIYLSTRSFLLFLTSLNLVPLLTPSLVLFPQQCT